MSVRPIPNVPTVDRSGPIWAAAYGTAFALEVAKRKGGSRPKSLRAIERDAAQIRSFCIAVADLAAGAPSELR